MLVDRERRADKKCRSVRSGVRNRTYSYVITHYGSAPDHTRPEGVDQVGDHISSRGAKVHGVGEACLAKRTGGGALIGVYGHLGHSRFHPGSPVAHSESSGGGSRAAA